MVQIPALHKQIFAETGPFNSTSNNYLISTGNQIQTGGLLAHNLRQNHSVEIDNKSFFTSHSFDFGSSSPSSLPADKQTNAGKIGAEEALQKQAKALLPPTLPAPQQTHDNELVCVNALLALFSSSNNEVEERHSDDASATSSAAAKGENVASETDANLTISEKERVPSLLALFSSGEDQRHHSADGASAISSAAATDGEGEDLDVKTDANLMSGKARVQSLPALLSSGCDEGHHSDGASVISYAAEDEDIDDKNDACNLLIVNDKELVPSLLALVSSGWDQEHRSDGTSTISSAAATTDEDVVVETDANLMSGKEQVQSLLDLFSSGESSEQNIVKEIETSHVLVDRKLITQQSTWMKCHGCKETVFSKIQPEDSPLHYLLCVPIKFAHQALLATFQFLAVLFVLFVVNPFNSDLCLHYRNTLLVALLITSMILFVAQKTIPRNGQLDQVFKNIIHLCPNCGITLAFYRFAWDSMVGTFRAEANLSGGVDVKTRSDLNVKAVAYSDHRLQHQIDIGMDVPELRGSLGVNVAPVQGNLDVNVSPINVNARAEPVSVETVNVKHSTGCTIM